MPIVKNMKIDLLTIFPGIVLETKKIIFGKEVIDPDAYDEIVFGNAHIISYKKLMSNSNIFDKKYKKYINQIHNKIIDSTGNQLTDYTIILDKNINWDSLKPPTSDSQQLITYFSYFQNLDFWISIYFIKIICFHDKGRVIYLNNRDEHWSPKYSFLLPIEQSHKRKILLHKNREKLLIDIFSTIREKNLDRYKKLINALTLFNESCRINQFNPNSSIILIVSAFESLLGLPRRSKKKSFVYALKILFGFDENIEKWADQLYELRSQIVHGDVLEGEELMASKDRHYPHFKIAKKIFHNLLLFILEGYGNIEIDKSHKFEVIKALKNKVISNREKVNYILEHKKKFSYLAFVNNKDLYKEFILRVESLTLTDYSARNIIKKLLNIIFSIAKDWIEAEKAEDYKISHEKYKEYIKFRNEKFDNILKLFNDIKQIKWTLNNFFQVNKKMRNLAEEVRQLEPVIHKKDEFNFEISEFLDRCLQKMFGIY